MKRTYIDASVLIEAFRCEDSIANRALGLLDNPNIRLVVSDYLRLEALPKPTFHNRVEEIEFMSSILESASEWVASSSELTEKAVMLAAKYDLTPIDALHIAAAVVSSVDEVLTMEKPTKPMCKVTEVSVISLHSASGITR